MIAALRRLFAPQLQPDAVSLASIIAERENLRQERDRALAERDAAEASRAAEFNAAERYLAERDRAVAQAAAMESTARWWIGETDRANRLLDVQSAARLGGHDLPPGVAVLAEFRRTKPGAITLPFTGRVS